MKKNIIFSFLVFTLLFTYQTIHASFFGDLFNHIFGGKTAVVEPSNLGASATTPLSVAKLITTPTKDLTPRISYWSGKVNQHVDIASSSWQTDPDGSSGSSIDKLVYCKKFYPNTTSVVAYKTETINSWYGSGNKNNYASSQMSYSCVQNTPGTIIGKHSCNQNKFDSAFLLISPDPSDQKTKDFLDFLGNFKTKFEQSFQDATYDLATYKVDDIFVTKSGSENYLTNPSQVDFNSAIKDLIAKKGDKYDFINVFTTYDSQSGSDYFFSVQNNVKNIGMNIFDYSKNYGSSGKLLGVSFLGDLLSQFKKAIAPDKYGNTHLSDDQKSLFGIGVLLHEIGHHSCCYIGSNFLGDGDSSKLEILTNNMHFYEGLESPPKTQDVLGTVPWLFNKNNNTYYEDRSFSDYPLRYHPITLYLMGLLPKDQYSTKFNIFNGGTNNQIKETDVKIYKTISVNDIIKFAGERNCVK